MVGPSVENEVGIVDENDEANVPEEVCDDQLAESSPTESSPRTESSPSPMVAEPVNWKSLLKPDYSSSSDDSRKRVLAMSASRNKSTYKKVEEAVSMIGTGGAGASIPAIITWITNNYPVMEPSKLKVNVKRAVLKGLKGGRLVRTKTSKKAQGVSGSFTFPAQRIKLKAVRLEGKRYLFPILQQSSSVPSADVMSSNDIGNVPSDVPLKRRGSVDEGNTSSPKRQASSTPRRLPKSKKVESPRLNASVL